MIRLGGCLLLGLSVLVPFASASVPESEAVVSDAQGRISAFKSAEPWALSAGDRVATQGHIATGSDGFGRFETADGNSFELYGDTRVLYRRNVGTPGDLLDVFSGRARIHLHAHAAQPERIFTPIATITAYGPATIALAIGDNDTVRIDVLEGEVHVQHRLLPRNDAALVKAMDSVLVDRDEPLERETLCKHAIKRIQGKWTTLFPAHRTGE